MDKTTGPAKGAVPGLEEIHVNDTSDHVSGREAPAQHTSALVGRDNSAEQSSASEAPAEDRRIEVWSWCPDCLDEFSLADLMAHLLAQGE